MEALAPYAFEAVNLCAPLAEWLELLGFEVDPHSYWYEGQGYLTATWRTPEGTRFHFEYAWHHSACGHRCCDLWADTGHLVFRLLSGQLAASLAEAQRLLLGNTRFRFAYALAHPTFDFSL